MTMTADAIRRAAVKVTAGRVAYEALADTADLVHDVGLDSLELLQFMLEIESSLAIEIDFEKLEFSYLESIAGLAAFLDTMPRRRTGSTAS